LILNILDSEYNEERMSFTIMCYLNFFFISVPQILFKVLLHLFRGNEVF